MTEASVSAEGRQFTALIAKADRANLATLVNENLRRFEIPDVLQVLRHPFLSGPVVEEILASPRFVSVRAVRRALALHPVTPRHAALHCLDDLTWRDLLDIGREARVAMPIRRSANLKILERLPRLAVGEKISLARFADRDLIPALLRDPDTAVLSALLRNARLMPEDLIRWITTGRPLGRQLAFLANDEAWRRRPNVRLALLLCRETPLGAALALLPGASRAEWRALTDHESAHPILAEGARELLEMAKHPVDSRPRPR